MVTRRTGYASRTTNYLLYKTRNPTPAAAPKGFGAMVGAEAAWCRGTPVTLGTPPQWRGLSPHHCQPLLTQDRATHSPGHPDHGASPRTAMPRCPAPCGVVFIFSSKMKIVLSGDQSLMAAFPHVCRVQQSLTKEFLCLGHLQGPLSLCVVLGLINSWAHLTAFSFSGGMTLDPFTLLTTNFHQAFRSLASLRPVSLLCLINQH